MNLTKKPPFCSVIIVTHNSQKYIDHCISALKNQTMPPQCIVIVDSGSSNTEYLSKYQSQPTIHINLRKENIGFCQGNNVGMSCIPPNTDYVLFLNPDAFLTPHFIEEAINYMEQPSSIRVGALSGLLLGFDINQKKPTGKIDSSGIFQKWYGKWFDRGQGSNYHKEEHIGTEKVPGLCGALMFCRMKALESVLLSPYVIMDPSFYMYKEDIDLSLRLRKKGWTLILLHEIFAYHCRGWQSDRSKVPRHLRLMSAKNELRLHARRCSPHVGYSALKYCAVKFFNM